MQYTFDRILILLVEFLVEDSGQCGELLVGSVRMLLAIQNAVSVGRITGSLQVLIGLPGGFLPCRMLGCTGNSCWRMPCICLHRMSLAVVVFLGDFLWKNKFYV